MNGARSKYFGKGLKIFLLILLSTFAIAASQPTLNIPQVPLILASPIHPQILIAIGNSESMDGNLAGAIMTGSGSLTGGLTSLSNSSSPINYTVPTGFTPPVQAANSSGQAPYTVSQSGVLVDNSPSRLNVAKAGIQAIINTYMESTDFALETYSISGVGVYNTWVYYMSPQSSNFSFTSTQVAGNTYVQNPCYNYSTASSTVQSNCSSIASFYGSSVVSSNLYMQIGSSSDFPSINDVLYASTGLPGVFLTYSGPSPATPYPPNFSISNYNSGNVLISYSKSLPNIGGFSTSPTNAGFVPFSPQVLYVQRGFGYNGSQSATTGNVLVPMTSAGTTPTQTSINNAISVFTPYLQPETNSSSTKEIKSAAVQSPIAGLLTKANSYLTTLGTTSGNGCPQKKYVILISDGLPTQDLSGKLWPPLGSAAATGYGITATFNTDGSLKSTNCQALTDAISTITTLKQNGIPTYVIGLGAGVNPSLNPQAASTLTAMAVAGGTTNYYPATSSTDLVNDLNSIMISIQNGSYTTTAASVSSTQLSKNSVEYKASFVSNDSPYLDWTGSLVALPLNPATGIPTGATNWNAQPLLDTLVTGSGWSSNRFIATWNPTTNTGVPFEWANISTSQQTALQPSDSLGQQRLQYLRGNTALELHNGGSFRNRSHILGDIIDSQVLYVGPPSAPYTSSSYLSFAQAQANRTPMVYVGANDGMLHAFNAVNGQEVFAFIPNGVFNNLVYLTSPLYNLSHRFYVDGSPQSADVQFSDSSWHTVLVSSENGGGNSIFGLDITNPINFVSESNLAQKVLWEFTDTDMGLGYSQPQIAQIGSSSANPATFAVFFGNGYNNPNNTAILYAINPQTGALIRKINLCNAVPGSCSTSTPQGLSSVAVANLNGFQGVPITNVYAGDLQGNMWSVNVSDPNPANWTVRLLFQAKNSSGTAQSITTAPVVTLNPNYPRIPGLFVMFGTGQLLQTADLLNTQTQTIYGVLDKPQSSVTYTRTNLQQQTLNLVSTSTSGLSVPVVTASSTPVNWNNQFGWYTDMITSGQRIVTNPTIFNGAFISTLNTPPQSCGTSFSSMLLELNFKTGGSFPNPQITGVSASGSPNNQYLYSGVVGIQLSNNFANAPTVVANQNNYVVLLITQANGSQSTILNPNTSQRKTGWWQLQ
ncbi:pilus assembly protein [Legionella sp. 227]|uniref:pilus assembly protein n=1 Tax=Legionella sp. 227 TaxID=3367288 RepID=UPI00370D1C72